MDVGSVPKRREREGDRVYGRFIPLRYALTQRLPQEPRKKQRLPDTFLILEDKLKQNTN